MGGDGHLLVTHLVEEIDEEIGEVLVDFLLLQSCFKDRLLALINECGLKLRVIVAYAEDIDADTRLPLEPPLSTELAIFSSHV